MLNSMCCSICYYIKCTLVLWNSFSVYLACKILFFNCFPLILSWHTCCRVSFPPWRGLHAANNRCRRSYFDTFQFYFTSSWRTVGVWYLVSLEIATPGQIEQSGSNVITQTILWPSATKLTWLTAQEEHRQIQRLRTPFPTLLHLLYYQCDPIYFV